MKITDKILIAGAAGMGGNTIIRAFLRKAFRISSAPFTVLPPDFGERVRLERPDHVFLAAAKVGGIHAKNIYPAPFIHDNLRQHPAGIGNTHGIIG